MQFNALELNAIALSAAAAPAPRLDLYSGIHKALRAAMADALITLGRCDPQDDTDLAVAKAYGVAGSGLGGLLRSVVGVSERVTFIIDEKGRISHVIDDPNCPDHGAEVLAAL